MKAVRIGQKVDTSKLAALFFSSQFPITSPSESIYSRIDEMVKNDSYVTKIHQGLYEVGFGDEQMSFIHEMMKSFSLEDFNKMMPIKIIIQRTGLTSGSLHKHDQVPSGCVRFIMNYREEEGKKQVGLKLMIGPGGMIYTSRSYATVLQRNFSSVEISSGKDLLDTRRETCNSYFVIVDMQAPTMLIMKIVDNTAGVHPIDFDKLEQKMKNNPNLRKVVNGIVSSVDSNETAPADAMQMIQKIMSQQSVSQTNGDVADL